MFLLMSSLLLKTELIPLLESIEDWQPTDDEINAPLHA